MAYAAWSVIAGETPTASKWNVLGTNDADFDSRIAALVADKTLQTAADGATVTLNLANGLMWHTTIAGNRTIALSNVRAGVPFVLIIKQDGTGSRTVTWFSTITWVNGVAPTLSTAANAADAFVFMPKVGSTNTFYGIPAGNGMV